MAKKDGVIEIEGVISEALPNAMFRVELSNGHKVLATISGKMRQNYIRIIPGDRVSEVLNYVQFSSEKLIERMRKDVDKAVRAGKISLCPPQLRRSGEYEIQISAQVSCTGRWTSA